MQGSSKKNQLPPDELALFCEQTVMLLTAGIQLGDGMEALCANYSGGPFEAEIAGIASDMHASSKLHDALAHAGAFPGYMVGMVRIGERTGRLDEVLRMLAKYYAWEADISRSVKNAVLYPAVLMILLAAVIAVMIAAVLPVFDRVYAGLDVSTEYVGAGAAAGRITLIVIGAALLALAIVMLLLRTGKRESVLAFLSKAFPPLGRAVRRLAAARFASAISIMLKGGYDIDEALRLASDVSPDEEARSATAACRERMQNGVSFANAVSGLGFFDAVHNKMLTVGEASGQLDAAMTRLAEIYQDEADRGIYYLVSLIEPLIVALLSVIIGGILLSVMLPMLNVLTAMM